MGKIRSLFRSRIKSRSMPDSSPLSPPHEPDQPQADDLTRVFKRFDSNGDGKISAAELGAIFESLGHPVTEEELQTMMGEADSDGDGSISLAEFVDLNTKDVDANDAIEDLRHAFSVFDLDRNGSISPDELARVLKSLGEGATAVQCKRMIDGVDSDGDGLISFEEFKVMMTGSSLPTVKEDVQE